MTDFEQINGKTQQLGVQHQKDS